jgi:hypothetical protein
MRRCWRLNQQQARLVSVCVDGAQMWSLCLRRLHDVWARRYRRLMASSMNMSTIRYVSFKHTCINQLSILKNCAHKHALTTPSMMIYDGCSKHHKHQPIRCTVAAAACSLSVLTNRHRCMRTLLPCLPYCMHSARSANCTRLDNRCSAHLPHCC